MSVADAAAVNLNIIKKLLANGLSLFSFDDKPVFIRGSRGLLGNPPNCTILKSGCFYNIILADQFITKVLRRLKTCLSVNNNLSVKLISSLESAITFEERFNITSVPFFVLDFHFVTFEIDDFTFMLLY